MKKTIAVFFGGVTPEHDISIVTAIASVIKPLEMTNEYDVVPVYISKKGIWYSDASLKDIATFRKGDIDSFLDRLKPVSVIFDGGLSIQKQGIRKQITRIDIAFPAMHGANGEDGSLMGLLRLANVPFVGCDITASVIAMDKLLAKQIAEANGIAIAKYEYLYGRQFREDSEEIISRVKKTLKFPVFVKPAHLGSSIGITKVDRADSLHDAIEVALYYDDKVLVEEAVGNLIEVTVPIIGNEVIRPAFVERPLSSDEFFDFDTKYMQGGKKTGSAKQQRGAQGYSELPAKLPKNLYDESIAVAQKMFRSAECEGIARIDLLIDGKAGRVYFNEINPLPGSLYSHNWRAAGLSGVELVTKLVQYAEDRHVSKSKLQKTFPTNFLKQF